MRRAKVSRSTSETTIEVEIASMARAAPQIETGVGFFDHMLELFARHSLFDLTVKAKGDTHVDDHHTVEDVGIAMGEAILKALGDKKGIVRYGEMHLPMDEAMARVAVDVSGRPFLVFEAPFASPKIGSFDAELVREWFQAFAVNARITLHAEAVRGRQQPPYRRSPVQGTGARAAPCGFRRSARGGTRAIDQGNAVRSLPCSSTRCICLSHAGSSTPAFERAEFVRDGFNAPLSFSTSSGACGRGCGSPRWGGGRSAPPLIGARRVVQLSARRNSGSLVVLAVLFGLEASTFLRFKLEAPRLCGWRQRRGRRSRRCRGDLFARVADEMGHSAGL